MGTYTETRKTLKLSDPYRDYPTLYYIATKNTGIFQHTTKSQALNKNVRACECNSMESNPAPSSTTVGHILTPNGRITTDIGTVNRRYTTATTKHTRQYSRRTKQHEQSRQSYADQANQH